MHVEPQVLKIKENQQLPKTRSNAKRNYGYYEIYESEIDNVLNSVFNEEQYYFWYKQIEKVAKVIILKTNLKPSIKELNDYFKQRETWDDLDGILFQDLPTNSNKLLIEHSIQ